MVLISFEKVLHRFPNILCRTIVNVFNVPFNASNVDDATFTVKEPWIIRFVLRAYSNLRLSENQF